MIDVVCAIFERDGKVLICRRREGLKNAGKWEFPGGKVNVGEAFESALKREIKEELGADINIGRKIAHLKFVESGYSLLGYECKALSSISCSTDHDRLEWVEKLKLLKFDLLNGDKIMIEDLLTQGYLLNQHSGLDQNGNKL